MKRKALPRNSCDTFISRKSTDSGIYDSGPETWKGSTEVSLSPTLSQVINWSYFSKLNWTYVFHIQGQDHCSRLKHLIRMIWKALFSVISPSLNYRCLMYSYCSGKRSCDIIIWRRCMLQVDFSKNEEILKSFSNLFEHRRCSEKHLSQPIYDKD